MKDILLMLCGIGVGIALSQRRNRRVFIGPTIKIDARADAEIVRKAVRESLAAVAFAVRRGGILKRAIRG